MKFRVPLYYKEFHCIADKCKDSCCSAGWEIDIDEKTSEFYKKVNGSFGNKLRKNISNSSPCHFILDKYNNCPFLNNKKLCDIYTNLGEEHLCQICKDHPRYYEWFYKDGIKEAGIGLCCEEAARIILSDNMAFKFLEEECTEDDNNNSFEKDDLGYDSEVYEYIFVARNKIFSYLDNCDIPLTSKLRNILWYGHTLQQDIDYNLFDDEEIIDVSVNNKSSLATIVDYFSTLEPNDFSWPYYLKKCEKSEADFCEHLQEFEAKNPAVEKYLKNIASYFIWRYFIKGLFDYDVLSKVKLMYTCVLVLKYLFFCKWFQDKTLTLDDCIEIVKKFSEEVEYCEDNLFKFAVDSYDFDILETEYLLGL